MGCCGGRKTTTTAAPRRSTSTTALLPGSEGMVLLEYTGGSDGKISFWGPVSHTRYVFGGKTKFSYVDARDVEGMLAIIEGKHPIFHRAPVLPKQPPVEAVAPETLVEEATIDPDLAVATVMVGDVSDGEITELRPDVGSMTLVELRDAIITASPETIEVWLAQEREGKRRAGAIQMLLTAKGE